MRKDQYFTGQPVVTQLLSFIKRSDIQRGAKSYQAYKYYKKFKTYDHLVTMLFAIYQRSTLLREVTTGMQASMHKLNHLGMTYCPRRSALSESNANRNIVTFDKGNVNYVQYDLWSDQKISWVTRLKAKGSYEIVSQRNKTATDIEAGDHSDHYVLLGSNYRGAKKRAEARLIKFYDKENDRHFNFITNNNLLSAKSIALIY